MNWTEEQFAEHMRRIEPLDKALYALDDEPAIDTRSEAQIEAECSKLLEEDGWRALRTDPVSDRGRGKGFGEFGMADHLYMRYCAQPRDSLGYKKEHTTRSRSETELMWIEFKSAKGTPKKHQLDWHAKERARGALTLIAGVDFPASVDGFKGWYASSGLRRRA